jgi:nucleoside-diphosphate-sugar epimerase
VLAVTGANKPVVEDAARFRPEASEVRALVADSRLLRDASGWTPAIDLDNGVARTVDWCGPVSLLAPSGRRRIT